MAWTAYLLSALLTFMSTLLLAENHGNNYPRSWARDVVYFLAAAFGIVAMFAIYYVRLHS